MVALLLSILNVLGFFLARRLASTSAAKRGTLAAIHAGVRNDPRRRLRHHDHDLWRPRLHDIRPRNIDAIRLMADARRSSVHRDRMTLRETAFHWLRGETARAQ